MDGYQQYSRYGAPRQGQGFYNPYMRTPDWGQGANRLGEILMQMYMMKKGKEQEKYERGMAERQMKLAEEREQRLAQGELTDRDYRSLYGQFMMSSGQWNPNDANRFTATGKVPISEEIERVKELTRAEEDIKKEYAQPKPPTQFEVKQTVLGQQLASGKITQAQYDEALWDIKPKPSAEDMRKAGANVRQANARWLDNFYTLVDKNKAQKEAKKAGTRPQVHGMFLDMPVEYNLATLNYRDGVATPEDLDAIKKYNAMLQLFLTDLASISLKDFMASPVAKDPDIDTAFIRNLYKLYR